MSYMHGDICHLFSNCKKYIFLSLFKDAFLSCRCDITCKSIDNYLIIHVEILKRWSTLHSIRVSSYLWLELPERTFMS